MHYKKMFPSRYLRAVDFEDSEKDLVIHRIEFEMFGQGTDAEEKSVLYFAGISQGLVLNLTNSESIADLHGDDVDGWPGNPVTLYQTKVKFRKDRVDAIRIRATAGQNGQKETSQPDEADSEDEADGIF